MKGCIRSWMLAQTMSLVWIFHSQRPLRPGYVILAFKPSRQILWPAYWEVQALSSWTISTSRGALYNPEGLNVDRLVRLTEEAGSRVVEFYHDAEFVDREKLLELPVDILCPCARWNSLNMSNAPRIPAQVISPGANNPITPDAEHALFERGVLCFPDFVTNCGGVLGGTMEFASVSRGQLRLSLIVT